MNLIASIREDVRCVFERDPAANSWAMVLFCYPGLHALWAHHIHHWLWCRNFRLLPRWMSQVTRFWTGVEIHPGAQIGRRVFIDHGMGVVIGETAVVGDDVTLYQGVTLGGTGKEVGKRHPTLRSGVFVGNNANILGNITIGENSRVGAGSVVVRDVPPDSTVVGVPAHIVYQGGKRVLITDPHEINDPLSDVIIALSDEVKRLKCRLEKLDGELQTARQEPATPFTVEEEERAQ
jgi:serine O-acetyltransferase